jgi:predicted nucleic-acid-binding protein
LGSGTAPVTARPIAIDTNIVVRYALKDDVAQARRATEFLRDSDCLLLATVVLEAVWVMSSKRGYGLDAETVANRLRHIAGLPKVQVEQPHALAAALDWYTKGMDFADAFHLALSDKDKGLATFDQRLGKRASTLKLEHPVVLLASSLL